ncbi:hypothetical protein [Streptomyces sp. c-19]|uniref:hypothetical protein n=1 Tax=Streptomyces sp. c-19 TaxID=2789275 RepID=UPI00397F2754
MATTDSSSTATAPQVPPQSPRGTAGEHAGAVGRPEAFGPHLGPAVVQGCVDQRERHPALLASAPAQECLDDGCQRLAAFEVKIGAQGVGRQKGQHRRVQRLGPRTACVEGGEDGGHAHLGRLGRVHDCGGRRRSALRVEPRDARQDLRARRVRAPRPSARSAGSAIAIARVWDTTQAAVRRTSGSGEANSGSSNESRSATAARTMPGAAPRPGRRRRPRWRRRPSPGAERSRKLGQRLIRRIRIGAGQSPQQIGNVLRTAIRMAEGRPVADIQAAEQVYEIHAEHRASHL